MTTSASTDYPSGLTPAQLLYPDLKQELATTRRMLERVPDGQNDWRPHAKSMSLGQLATHLAELPRFAQTMFTTSELDFAKTKYEPTVIDTTAERLAFFDERAKEMATMIDGADWNTLREKWKLCAGDQVYVNEDKGILLRTLALSHMAHHRAQLGVFLRLLGVAVPGAYGPSADEM